MRPLLLCCLLALPLIAHAEISTDLAGCTKIENNSDRLDCFDTISASYKQHSKLKINTRSTETKPNANNFDTLVISKEDSFGKSVSELIEIESINSTIVGEFKGWKKGAIIKLANGQKWRVTSSSAGYVKILDPKVEISRGFWGSYNMKVKGLNAKAKVKRIK